ncbi:uncharacterized protein LOC121726989 [Aricia agestis]|uniref:uncharacterized protein LOC121726989 n=1 Tax=Aricia agestis TaxID=91739 RepID=UPI001C203E7F|nr:uncharacterized protein LOC121726989 [Aricia agestis]
MAGAAAAAPVHPPGPHDALADMLSKLLTLALLALATLPAARAIDEDEDIRVRLSSYKTVESRLLNGVPLRRGPSYLVPAGRCNVTLTSRELCGEGLVVASLEVAVVNPDRRYVNIVFEMRDHHRVRVDLGRSCPEPWSLDLRLACLRQKHSRSHSRVPLDLND